MRRVHGGSDELSPPTPGSFRKRVEQWPDPVVHHLTHHQCGGGAFDTFDVQNVPGHPIQIVGVLGCHVDEQVGDTAESVHLEHLGYRVQRRPDPVEFALRDVGEHVGLQRITQHSWIDPAFERTQRPGLVELAQPCLNGVAGQPCSFGYRHHGGAWIVGQCGQDSSVDPVGSVCAWQSANLPVIPTAKRGA